MNLDVHEQTNEWTNRNQLLLRRSLLWRARLKFSRIILGKAEMVSKIPFRVSPAPPIKWSRSVLKMLTVHMIVSLLLMICLFTGAWMWVWEVTKIKAYPKLSIMKIFFQLFIYLLSMFSVEHKKTFYLDIFYEVLVNIVLKFFWQKKIFCSRPAISLGFRV